MGIISGIQPIVLPPLKSVAPEVELNIRLDVRNVRNDINANTERAEAVVGLLRSRIGNVQFRRITIPDGTDLLLAAIGAAVDPDVLDDLAYAVSIMAMQDCIAVYLRGINQGRLIGPQASNWPDFDLNEFRSFQLEK